MSQGSTGVTRRTRECPKCGSIVPAGHMRCLVCRLEVARMDALEGDASRRRAKEQRRRDSGPPWWTSKAVIFGALLLVAAIVAVMFAGSQKKPAWMNYPLGKDLAVSHFMNDIAGGQSEDLDHAYKLMAPDVIHPKNPDDEAAWQQLYVEINKYLTGEFGNDWPEHMTINPSEDDSDLMDVHVDVETLHVRVQLQTPTASLTGANGRYAIVGVNEFDISEARAFQAREAQMGVIRGIAGDQAVKNLQNIIAGAGNGGRNQHESRMQTKMRLLPNLRDPRSVYAQTVLQTWVVRKDPVIRRRLTMITQDGRYTPQVQQYAKQVLDNRVDEADLDAVSVDPDAPG